MTAIKTIVITHIEGDFNYKTTFTAWSDGAYTMNRTYYDIKEEAYFDYISRSYASFEEWDKAIIEEANLVTLFRPVNL